MENEKPVRMTQEDLDNTYNELDERVMRRKLIAEDIAVARDFGDLSENAEYHSAKEEQAKNEMEINTLVKRLENYVLVEGEDRTDIVTLCAFVKVRYIDFEEEEVIQLVTNIGSDPLEGRISEESPFGISLTNAKQGATLSYSSPQGNINFEILEISREPISL